MTTIKVSSQQKALKELLKKASQDDVILRAPDGREFFLVELDDFDREIQRTRQNKEFMRLLDERGREKATISAAELRKSLGLPPFRSRRTNGTT